MSTNVPRGEAAARYAKEHQVSLFEAARHFGISRERVRQKWRHIFGDEPTPVQKYQDQRAQTIAKFANLGMSATEIAAETDIIRSTVYSVRDRIGVTMVRGVEKNGVTDETKAMILELARTGKSRAKIALETGASYNVVNRLLIDHSTSTRGVPERSGRSSKSAMASEVMDDTGCSLSGAAAMFALSPPALWSYRKRRGLRTT